VLIGLSIAPLERNTQVKGYCFERS
jgi:hypothetical protein